MIKVENVFEDVVVFKSKIIYDNRGSFIKDFVNKEMRKISDFKQIKENFYTSSKISVLRGLHFQRHKQQSKIVTCLKGEIFDVVVDLRRNSKNFGKYYSIILSEKNGLGIIIPKGYAHGYLVLQDSIVNYKCDEQFYEEFDDGIKWDDPEINISWPIDRQNSHLTLSNKDKNLQTFASFKENYYSL